MPEPAGQRSCPYLRGRRRAEPFLTPHEENHCLVAASIYLPPTWQSRYCLGGRHAACPRFELQSDRPLPQYVTGVQPPEVYVSPPPPPLQPRFWRRPLAKMLIRWLLIALFVGAVVAAWRWQMSQITPRQLIRQPLPTPVIVPVEQQLAPWLPPAYGPTHR